MLDVDGKSSGNWLVIVLSQKYFSAEPEDVSLVSLFILWFAVLISFADKVFISSSGRRFFLFVGKKYVSIFFEFFRLLLPFEALA